MSRPEKTCILGSSPRVRGTVGEELAIDEANGIIPACAGNRLGVQGAEDIDEGSSPRVRGTGRGTSGRRRDGGIIPACAGNSFARPAYCCRTWDHPRVCGEQPLATSMSGHGSGSSPRVRGTGIRQHQRRGYGRIIPACAGNSGCCRRPCIRHKDHPRVCGEQHNHCRCTPTPEGSSPRVRGTEGAEIRNIYGTGIIPACAGNRCCSGNAIEPDKDHPRVCGEQAPSSIPSHTFPGSSPRVRGTVGFAATKVISPGIIPACAGNRKCS